MQTFAGAFLNGSYWLALAATLLLAGAIAQTIVAVRHSLENMRRFLLPRNELFREELALIRSTVPAWKILDRRKARKRMEADLLLVLSPEELRIDKDYDRQSLGWSLILLGSLAACVVSWTQVSF
jgi:hypothetical protein